MIAKFTYLVFLLVILGSCNKYLEIKEVEDEYLAEQVFSSDSAANSAVAGIYRKWRDLYNSTISPSVLCGLSADELKNYFLGGYYEEFYQNQIKSQSQILPWASLYNIIYQANAIIESLSKSILISEKDKKFYEGEAKFIRAHCYFNLINLFGDVPLLLTTNVHENSMAERKSKEIVCKQIVADLKDADSLLKNNTFSSIERLNPFVAKSLLARVYLFTQDWEEAGRLSNAVIESQKFKLEENLDRVFISGSSEAIFQFSNNEYEGNAESLVFIPTSVPNITCSNSLISSFEKDDHRRVKWVNSGIYINANYFYPFKYKAYQSDLQERYTLFRLAEQFLIRAEANIHSHNITESVNDLNTIRVRAGLSMLNDDIGEDSCLNALMQERRVELFAETGHRWFDLKRTGKINEIMKTEKGDLWTASDSLYPIPAADIQRNPNLAQNPDY